MFDSAPRWGFLDGIRNIRTYYLVLGIAIRNKGFESTEYRVSVDSRDLRAARKTPGQRYLRSI